MNRTLVFGASPNPNRYSNIAINRLRDNNIDTVAFGTKNEIVRDVQIKTNLNELQNIDVVTLYMRSELQKKYYKEIIALQPNSVIFNPGTENPEFYKLLQENNIKVQVACTLVLLATNQYND